MIKRESLWIGVAVAVGMAILLRRALPSFADPPAIATTQPTTCPSVDEELVKRLLGGKTSAVDAVEAALSAMVRAGDRLHDNLDPGEGTQAAQKEALANIDKLVEQARSNKPVSKDSSQVRRRPERKPDRSRSAGQQKASAPGPAPSKGDAGAPGTSGKESRRLTDRAELSRGWGFLPPKDREEISQGFDDQFHPKYRAQIERYYRELAARAEKAK